MEDARKEAVGKALGRIPSGLFILTSTFDDSPDGMLASWVQQAAFDPPMVTVAVKKERGIRLKIEASEHFVLNVIGQDDGSLMGPFFKAPPPGETPFDSLATRPCDEAAGAPILTDGLAWMACELSGLFEAGDNVIYLGEVVAGEQLKDGDSKTHLRKDGFGY